MRRQSTSCSACFLRPVPVLGKDQLRITGGERIKTVDIEWIAIANALMIMLLLKGLFPDAVPLLANLREAGSLVKRFWSFAWLGAKPAFAAAKRQALAW